MSSCGNTVVQCLMFKEKGGAAVSEDIFFYNSTERRVLGCDTEEKENGLKSEAAHKGEKKNPTAELL